MPKSPTPLTLSRFFHENIRKQAHMHIEASPYFLEPKMCHKRPSNTIFLDCSKEPDQTEPAEAPTYFQNGDDQPISCNCFVYMKQEKNVKNNPEKCQYFFVDYSENIIENSVKKKKCLLGPKVKGFTDCYQKEAEMLKTKMELAVIRLEGNVREREDLRGFSQSDIEKSGIVCRQAKDVVKEFIRNQQPFKGFNEKDQNKPILPISTIYSACDEIKTQICRTIDIRVLTNYKKETEHRQKVIRSKYWRECTAFHPIVKSEHDDLVGWSREIKKEKLKEDEFDREQAILSQIQKLHQELVQIRKKKYSSSSGLDDIKQQSPFCQTKQELVIPPFVPPKSPHHLLEEDLYHNPWALLVATIFLNKTSGRSARPYVFWFLEENPDPFAVVGKSVDELETYFGALGLQRTRAVQVWKMSHDFLYKNWTKARQLFAIGKYGDDAFRMFCLGDFTFQPSDRYLKIYKAWYEMQEKEIRLKEMNT